MPEPHPTPPTPRQQRFLRELAQQTGTTFTPSRTKAQASQEIDRLLTRTRESRADQIRDRRTVQDALQRGDGDSVRHQPAESTGYGATARWTHTPEGSGR